MSVRHHSIARLSIRESSHMKMTILETEERTLSIIASPFYAVLK
jgi:hypothetical protein